MTQEQKDLLLKDLCGRLPYDVKCKIEMWIGCDVCTIFNINSIGDVEIVEDSDTNGVRIDKVKPYLFPLSSMTEEQKQYLKNRFCYDWNGEPYDLWKCQIEIGDVNELIDFFHKNHLDYHNLIPRGSAIDATGLNIY